MDKKEIIEHAYSLGFEYEKKYRGCSQCAIAAVQDALGIRNDFVFKAASGLAGGGGLLGVGFCGGYSGGVLMMSLLFGRERDKFENDREEKYCSFHMAVDLHKNFIDTYNSVICNDIHASIFGRNFNIWDKKEREEFEAAGAHTDKCTSVVARASAWTTELILDEIEKRNLTLKDFLYLRGAYEKRRL